jgi:hypothetical protein
MISLILSLLFKELFFFSSSEGNLTSFLPEEKNEKQVIELFSNLTFTYF